MLTITMKGGPNARVDLKRMERRFQDLSDAFELVHHDYVNLEESIFEHEAGPVASWPELSEPYRTRKEKEKPGAGILVYSGLLKSSFTGEEDTSNNQDGGTIKIVTDKFAKFGSNVSYAKLHQDGEGHLPARPPLQITDTNKRTWNLIVLRWAADQVRKIYPRQA